MIAPFARTFCLVLLFGLFSSHLSAESEVSKARESIKVGAETRDYIRVSPAKLEADHAYPVIFAFHGYRGEVKSWLSDYARFEEFVPQRKFIVIYPEGPIQWTASLYGRDVRLFDALLQKLKADFHVDEKRIYVVGHSNGAGFASYLAQVRPDVIAAAACHSGLLPPGYTRIAPPKHKAAILALWGEDDPIQAGNSEGVSYAVSDFKNAGFPIELVVFPKWGHAWAGKTHEVEEKILAFFEKHPFGNSGRQ